MLTHGYRRMRPAPIANRARRPETSSDFVYYDAVQPGLTVRRCHHMGPARTGRSDNAAGLAISHSFLSQAMISWTTVLAMRARRGERPAGGLDGNLRTTAIFGWPGPAARSDRRTRLVDLANPVAADGRDDFAGPETGARDQPHRCSVSVELTPVRLRYVKSKAPIRMRSRSMSVTTDSTASPRRYVPFLLPRSSKVADAPATTILA
jgi:hypothetical protein